MLFETFVIVTLSSSIQCSQVFDGEEQTGIHISDYCPTMKYCPEGAHVVCMFYDEKHVMGPRCRDPRNITMTTAIANKLLDVTNALRSKISQGVEKGKNGQRLPRGYGIFRLRWDNELATFAQLLANQCLLRHDFCRATKKFPDPGQAAGIVRFHGPDWIPASKAGNFTATGLTEEKLAYAITQTLKTWYAQKSQATVEMVANYPDWSLKPNNQQGRLYLTMIYGSATHMGCGISAYTDYVYYEQKASIFYNTILVVCNFSAQPRLDGGVYNTVPPTDTDSSFNSCGCPIGSLEDEDCLCLEVPRNSETELIHSQKPRACPSGMNCDPTVVLLPIISVEDAPPDKLVTAEKYANSSIMREIPETETANDSFEEIFDNNLSGDKTLRKSRRTLDFQPHNFNGNKQRHGHTNSVTVKNRRFDKPNEVMKHKESNHHDDRKTHRQGHMEKSSVFNKAPIFELPGSHYLMSSIKKDVIPRKDFSAGKQLVNKYLYSKNSIILPKNRKKYDHSHEHATHNLEELKSIETVPLLDDSHTSVKLIEHKGKMDHHEEVHFHDILTTETILSSAERKLINQKDSHELNLSQDLDFSEGDSPIDKNDQKFMALLDTLEKEVKHIEFRNKEKHIFDAKIKKIYDKIVGKHNKPPPIQPLKTHPDHLKKTKHVNTQKSEDDENSVHKLPPSFDAKEHDSNFIDEVAYESKLNTDIDLEDKFSKTDTEMELEELERPMAMKRKSATNYKGRQKYNHRNSNSRPSNRNYLSSRESVRHRYDNDLKDRKTYKNNFGNEPKELRHRSNSLDYRKNMNYYNNDLYDEDLNSERRSYYQDKLDNMERKLQDARRYNRRKETGRPSPHMRALKPSTRTDNQMNPLYTGRARILHGY